MQKLKKWHLRKKNYQKGPQHACSTWLCVFGRRLYSADGRRDRQTQTADADADARIADSDFEISKVLKSF